jgi:hypothetical protein
MCAPKMRVHKIIKIKNQEIAYSLLRLKRSSRLRVTIRPGGICSVSAPWRLSDSQIEGFLSEKGDWLIQKIEHMKLLAPAMTKKEERLEYVTYKEQAREIAVYKVTHFATLYKLPWKKIAIRNQKTRWGSCSRRGNLNFSYKLALLPSDLADYLIVHEVCHLKEFNHSERFWNLVALVIPDYKEKRAALKNFGKIQ